MTLESSFIVLVALILFILKPGPNMIALISRSLSDGFASGFAMALGNTTGQIIYYLLAVFGYSLIEAHLSFLSFFLKSVGAAYLIYIGIKGLLHLEAGMWGGKPDVQTKITAFENYFSGIAICLANPFTILFYAAIVPQIMPLDSFGWQDITLSTMMIAFTYLAMHTMTSYAASTAKNTLKNEVVVKRINFIVSFIFVGLGLFFIATLFPIFNFELNL